MIAMVWLDIIATNYEKEINEDTKEEQIEAG